MPEIIKHWGILQDHNTKEYLDALYVQYPQTFSFEIHIINLTNNDEISSSSPALR